VFLFVNLLLLFFRKEIIYTHKLFTEDDEYGLQIFFITAIDLVVDSLIFISFAEIKSKSV